MKSFSAISTLTTIYLFTLVATAGECHLVIIGFDESIIIIVIDCNRLEIERMCNLSNVLRIINPNRHHYLIELENTL